MQKKRLWPLSIGLRNRYSPKFYLIIMICIIAFICMYYYSKYHPKEDRRNIFKQEILKTLEEQLKLDKGTGCEIPVLDPMAPEIMQFDEIYDKVTCKGHDWVKCWLSECKVDRNIIAKYIYISCIYEDIIYVNDDLYVFGNPVKVMGAGVYNLSKSDHARVSCSAARYSWFVRFSDSWTGLVAGFRPTEPRPSDRDQVSPTNVLIFAFDSTARNGFIRKMPNSYKYLTEQLHAVVLKGYNIVGDGTSAALFPILIGNNELELPNVRKNINNNRSVSDLPIIFNKLRDEGFRTAYFEDSPEGGTFQWRFNGFRRQPADHYLRSFFQEQTPRWWNWWSKDVDYCVGDTPRYKLMMNLTNQFFHLKGKKFAFTIVADICHDIFNMIATADDDFVDFLKSFKRDGFLKDTMLLVMGDHGSRYSKVRKTYQGKLEERLPLMAIVLPSTLKSGRPRALDSLRLNVDTLTTPYDIYTTVLDAMALSKYWNPFKITGADLPRGMTLFEPIPRNRSCSEAGVEPHWCSCLRWSNVSASDPLHRRAAEALVGHINGLIEPVKRKCIHRTLSSVEWVMKQRPNSHVLSFVEVVGFDETSYGNETKPKRETYQVKLTVNPGLSDFEASMTYFSKEDKFYIDTRDISRTNKYGEEPACISKTHPHLNPFCYCISVAGQVLGYFGDH